MSKKNKPVKKRQKHNEEVHTPEDHDHTHEQLPFNLDDRIAFDELQRGVIRIDNTIDSFLSTEVLRKIEYLISHGVNEMSFMITSPGGTIPHSMALYDRIAFLPKQGIKTEALVEGYAASAAAMVVLQAVQKRYATQNSRMLLHEPRRWVMFELQKTSDVKDESREMIINTDMIYGILSKRTGKSKKQIEETINRKEVWLSAKEAKRFGLIDQIMK